MGFKNISLALGLLAMLGLAACESAVVSDGVCSVEEKADAKTVLENLDTIPLGEDGTKAIAAGCNSSKTDKEQFMIGLLGDLSIDPACSSEADLQDVVDNWEGADLSNITATCDGEVPSCSTPSGDGCVIDPDLSVTKITATHGVSISGRGYFLTVGFSEPIKTDTAALQLFVLLDTTKDADGNLVANFGNLALDDARWTDDHKGLIVPIRAHLDPKTNAHTSAGDYRFTIKAEGDAADHKADVTLTFTIEAKTAADSDNDGVADDKDLCPGTPEGTAVSDAGCPPLPPAAVDTDADGVEDSKDKCSGTMEGWAVDKDGCAIIYSFVPGYIFTKFSHQLKIVGSTPADGAVNVDINTSLKLSFDVGVNANSLKDHLKLLIFTPLGWFEAPVPLKLELSESTGKHYTFKPSAPLKAGAMYAIVVEGGVSTDLGLSPEDVSIGFSTKN